MKGKKRKRRRKKEEKGKKKKGSKYAWKENRTDERMMSDLLNGKVIYWTERWFIEWKSDWMNCGTIYWTEREAGKIEESDCCPNHVALYLLNPSSI